MADRLLRRPLLLLLLPLAARGHDDGHAHAMADLGGGAGLRRRLDPAASVAVNTTLIDDGGFVEVSFTSPSPLATDWLGVYSPAAAPLNGSSPVKWLDLGRNLAYLSTGAGSAAVQLVDMRADFAFYLFKGGFRAGVLVAEANETVSVRGSGAARRARVLPIGGAGDSLRVVWSDGGPHAPDDRAALHFGANSTAPEKLAVAPEAVPTPLAPASFCGPPASSYGYRDLGYTLAVEMSGVQALAAQSPSRTVFYTFGSGSGAMSTVRSVRVPPAPGLAFPTRIVVLGDLGRGAVDYFASNVSTWSKFGNEYSAPALATTQRILAETESDAAAVDALLIIGDLSYASGYLGVWDLWLFMLESLVGRVVTGVTRGNHEDTVPVNLNRGEPMLFDNNDSGGECGVAARTLMPVPDSAASAGSLSSAASTSFYAWAVGPVLLVNMASEVDFREGSAQWAWLSQTLAAADRDVTPFVVVTCHRPAYIDSTFGPGIVPYDDQEVAALLQLHVEPLLMAYKVTLCIGGHNHAVQRLSAIYLNRTVQRSVPAMLADGNTTHLFLEPTATVFAVWGTGGAGFTVNAHDAASRPDWSELVVYAWGYGRIVAENATVLQLEWVCNNGSVLDRTTIVQNLAQQWAGSAGGGGSGANVAASSLPVEIAAGAISGLIALAVCAACLLQLKRRAPEAAQASLGPVNFATISGYERVATTVEAWRLSPRKA